MSHRMRSIIFIVCVITLTLSSAAAQNPNPTPRPVSGNPAKLPPTINPFFVPDLRLRGSESVELNATVPKTYHKVTFLFQNWDKFPVESLAPTSKPPSLPPNPCKQVKTSARLFAVLHAKNGATIGCTELKPTEDFYFLLGRDKPLPAFVYVTVVDRTRQGIFKSSMVSPSSGATK